MEGLNFYRIDADSSTKICTREAPGVLMRGIETLEGPRFFPISGDKLCDQGACF